MVCFPIQIGSSKATFSSCLISVTHSWLGMNEGRLHNLLTLGSCVFSMGKHFPFHRFIDSLLHLILIKNFNSNYYTNCYIIYSPLDLPFNSIYSHFETKYNRLKNKRKNKGVDIFTKVFFVTNIH